ncbi:MAG: cytochrome b N-terminal domain-containing protein [Polyangiaceae bacterium]
MKRLLDWLDARLDFRRHAERVANLPVAGGASLGHGLAAGLVFTFVLLATTGLALMTVYAPTTTAAWGSVHYLSYVLPAGWLVRGLHYGASAVFLVLAVTQIARMVATAAYRRQHELAYWFALALFALVLAEAITGHLLPWDQRGYWARRVEMNIAGMTPVVGSLVTSVIQGGPELGQLGLTRFFTLHVAVIPFVLGALLRLHVGTSRRPGEGEASEPWGRRQMWIDSAFGVAVAALAFAVARALHGAPLDAPADPASDYPARPEWFLLPLFELRKHFHGALEFPGVAGVPALVGLYFAALPFVDAKPKASFAARLPVLAPAFLVALACVLFSVTATRRDASDAAYQKAAAKASAVAEASIAIARSGVPATGPLAMLAADTELRGGELFGKHCASCHVLAGAGDAAKATAPVLDGWGTEAWVLAVLHDPDADDKFGRTPFKEMMPSVDVAPKDAPPTWKGMSDDDKRAVAHFLALEGSEPGDPTKSVDEPRRELGRKIVKERCTTCHLFGGEGDDSSQEYAPELAKYGSLAWTRAQIANPATKATYREKATESDLKGHMPRFDGELSQDDLTILARYTRAKARGLALPR